MNIAELFAANYTCGHCNSETDTETDAYGMEHIYVRHDDGCPVLAGTLSSFPDTIRAAVPATFQPGP